ncbi:hypothetical protein Tsubulata_002605 [Turnera subulata]|uniref:Uncharacterized protein n=1 Tax=Turnera subulata TaxID=218843 RepID=A0A9Q0FKT5_9ROSI|nr:hypothetical protein Tsubulata_002605 [Turnera subulata]
MSACQNTSSVVPTPPPTPAGAPVAIPVNRDVRANEGARDCQPRGEWMVAAPCQRRPRKRFDALQDYVTIERLAITSHNPSVSSKSTSHDKGKSILGNNAADPLVNTLAASMRFPATATKSSVSTKALHSNPTPTSPLPPRPTNSLAQSTTVYSPDTTKTVNDGVQLPTH